MRERSAWDAGHAPHALHLPLSRPTDGAVLPDEGHGGPGSSSAAPAPAELLAARGVEAAV